MCYNYEYMVSRAEKRSAREEMFNKEENSSAYESERETISSFPGQTTVVIPISTKESEPSIFGFLPDWANSYKDGKTNYNCRSETILEKPTWKKSFIKAQRCLVPATAFYETDRATKKRYKFTVKNEPELFFAGIFNDWTDNETGEIFKTFAIITCAANGVVSTVWERMPVILNAYAQQVWMNTESSIDECALLLQSYPSELMELQEAAPLIRKKKSDTNLNLGF